jgi:metal-responsive CopG/Arc/MetJ family transcriptional regulator
MRKAEKKGPGRPPQFNRRVLLTVDDALLSAVDSWADQTGVENRSKAIRQLVEIGLKTNSPSKPSKRRTAKSIPISKLNASNDT